jgi:hypothetical protein
MKSTGETPPAPPRGAVTPPATRAALLIDLMARYPGLRRRSTYVSGDAGFNQIRLFGSFQIAHLVTKR